MNTDLGLLAWCRNTFGGGVYITATGEPKELRGIKINKTKICYAWVVSSGYAEKILNGCLPYFIIKGRQADVALEFQETFTGTYHERVGHNNAIMGIKGFQSGKSNKLHPWVTERRESLKLRLTAMKRAS